MAAQPRQPAIAELLAAATILRDRSFRPRPSHVFVGRPGADAAVFEPTQYEAPLREGFAAWGARHDLGAVLPVRSSAARAPLRYGITFEDRLTTHLVADGGLTVLRPLRSIELEYDPRAPAGRLTITTDRPEAVLPLARIAGEVFFGDPRHFTEVPAVDLWRLQELGPASLAVPELAGDLAVHAIGGTWHSGKSHAITPRGRDFFKALARYKIRIEGGRLDLVTLRARVARPDGGPATCDVVLRPPHHVTVSEPEAAPLVHRFLARARISPPDARPRDFFSRQPWIDAAAPWIDAEGQEGFDALLASGVLEADTSNRAVAPPGAAHTGPTATAHPLGKGRFLAVSPDPTVAPFVVEERDLVRYRLRFDRLAAVIARALGADGAASRLDDDGVLFCGRRALGPTFVLVFLLTRPIRKATVVRLRETAGHGHALLVTPEGRKEEHGLRELTMPKLAGPWRPLLGEMVRALRLEGEVETPLYAPEGARVVVHRATARVWVDGARCDAVEIDHVRLLEILIRHAGRPVHTKDIADHVSGGRPTEDTTRRVIQSFVQAVKKSFRAKKLRMPKDVERLVTMPKHGYYVLEVLGFVE